MGWSSGATVDVAVAFESATAARVSLRFRGREETRLLRAVPPCGLCFGVGLYHSFHGVELLEHGTVALA